MNATRWIKKFINIILNTHTDEWREYCLRKTTTKEDNSYLQPQIERLQQASQNFDIPHQTRQWFLLTEEETHEMSQQQIKNWISQAKKILKKASTLRRAQKPITEYFKKKTTNTTNDNDNNTDTSSKETTHTAQKKNSHERTKRSMTNNTMKTKKQRRNTHKTSPFQTTNKEIITSNREHHSSTLKPIAHRENNYPFSNALDQIGKKRSTSLKKNTNRTKKSPLSTTSTKPITTNPRTLST